MKWIRLTYLLLILFTGCGAKTDQIPVKNGVAELASLEIGGMKQWILIRGGNKDNSVLLWLHGGPGSAQMPIHHAYTKELENEFVVVHWDQRGAGKSNTREFREEIRDINLFSSINTLHIPVYFFTGEKDYNTPHQLVRVYYDFLEAPRGKYLVPFVNSAHIPFIGESEKFKREVVRIKQYMEPRIP